VKPSAAETSAGLRAGCEARCPGCAQRFFSALESETRKANWLKQRLFPWRDRFAALQAVQGEDRWGYRDRVRLSARWQEGCWQFGLMVRKDLTAIPRCPIHSERVRAMLELLAAALPPGPVFPLAFFIQAMAQVTLVLKTATTPELGWVDERFGQELTRIGIEGLWLHLHPAAGRRMFAKNGWRLLWGRPRSVDDGGLLYGPTAFQQVLPALYRRALAEAEAFLAPTAEDVVVDLYSGSGASLARWSECGANAVGVELGGEAVECARHNAPQAVLLRGKCADRIPQLEAWLDSHGGMAGRRLLYVNPPRTGLEPEVPEWVVGRLRPARLAYLSCSAGTLRRDLESLTGSGYRVERITPYDFFPHTYHLETLVLLRQG
jgi:23S rRNA (uracil1939-C5)-methyltransferase